jgi:hypothetical protein
MRERKRVEGEENGEERSEVRDLGKKSSILQATER